jgi:alanine dehydrogenase
MDTLLLTRKDVAELLSLEDCMAAVEAAFKRYALGQATAPKVLALHTPKGGFHIKAGLLDLGSSYFAAKINANFPGNPIAHQLPLIQGVVVVCDGENGRVLALMDSIELTILRTGAATALAAKHLALADATTAMICGCGNQGAITAKALLNVRPLEKLYVFDKDPSKAERFAATFSQTLNVAMEAVRDVAAGLLQSSICVTCTPSTEAFLHRRDVLPGTFIAAVGADNEDKQELEPELLSENKVVTDLTEQCKSIGELHHALSKGLMSLSDVHGELGDILLGKKPGRTSKEEIIVFDSTGTALQDVAAAAVVYEKALARGVGRKINFSNPMPSNEQGKYSGV